MVELPPLVAHRFGRSYGPDSSRAALDKALAGPLGGVETDCVLTSDEQVALLHDPQLAISTNLDGWAQDVGAGRLANARLRDAHGRVTSERPLMLEEGLDLLAERRDLIVQLEIKSYADPELAIRTAHVTCRRAVAHGGVAPERIEVISFWPGAADVAARHGLRARVIVACAYEPDALARWATTRGIAGVILEGAYFADVPIATWREAGLSVMSGVVNDAASLERVLRFTPDMVATDRPHELRAQAA
jgi:glycerophosphoryl diester phosphodiesterase